MADEQTEKIPQWAFLILVFASVAGLFLVVLDPLHLVPDSQAGVLAGAVGTAVVALIGPGMAKRL